MGVLLECFGQLINVLGKHSIGYGRRAADDPSVFADAKYFKSAYPYYALGLLLVCCYILMDLAALSYTDQTIITSCGGMAIVWNILIAPMTLGEAITKSRLTGAVIIVLGTILAAISGNHYDVEFSSAQYLELLKQPQAIAFYAVWGGGSILLILMLCRKPKPVGAADSDGADSKKEPLAEDEDADKDIKRSCWSTLFSFCTTSGDRNTRGFMWGMLAGFIAGNSWATKTAMSLLGCTWGGNTCEAGEGWDNPLTWGFGTMTLVIHVGAYIIIIWALKFYDALVVVTTSDAFTIVVGAVSGLLVLEEAQIPPLSTAGLTCYIIAVVVITIGLSVIMWRKRCVKDDGILMPLALCYGGCGFTMRDPDLPVSAQNPDAYDGWL